MLQRACSSLLMAAVGVTAAHQADTSSHVFPPVVVSALRSLGPVAAEPYAWTYRAAETWQFQRSYGVEAALQWIPGILVQDRAGNGDVRIVIRGFGARGAGDRSNNGTTRGVRILLDGVPLTEPDGRTALDLLEPSALAGVEVLRSNGTLLWGNASGGVVAFHTVPLSTPVAVAASAGSFGLRRATVQLTSVSSTGHLSIAGTHSTTKGWRHNAEGRRWWATVSWRSAMTPQTLVEFRGTVTANRFSIPGPLDWDTFVQRPTAANPTYQQQQARRDNRIGTVSLTLTMLPAMGQHLQLTAFLQPKVLIRSERGTYREFSRLHLGGSVLYQHQQLLTQHTAAVLTLGSDIAFQDGPATFYRLTPDGGRDSLIRQHKREAALNAGSFARLQLEFARQYTLWAGLRSEWLFYRLIDLLRPSLSDRTVFRALLPSAGVSYRLSEHHNLYLHISSGWEVPAYNEIDPPPVDPSRGINPMLKPMTSWTVELGSRHSLALSAYRLQAELALYWIDSHNELVPYGGGRFYQNAARSERIGAEFLLDVTWGRLSLQTVATLSRLRYRSYRIDSTYLGSSGQADFSGNRIPGIPVAHIGFRAAYTLAQLPLRIGTELTYSSSYYADDANTVQVPSHALWHISLQMAEPLVLAGLAVVPWLELRNVTNRRYISSVYINPDRDGRGRPLFAEPGLPRALTVGFHLRSR